MADTSTIYQAVLEGAVDEAESQVSQSVLEAGGDDSPSRISQMVLESGGDDAPNRISQMVLEAGGDDSPTRIHQVVIEWSPGPLVPPPAAVRTFRFDAGNRSHYWLALQPSDSGDELRSKVVKPGRVTGKVTNASMLFYKWDVGEEINVTDVEFGLNAATRPQHVPDVAHVTQSELVPVNVVNACLHSTRVQGTWEGDAIKDRIDEIVYQLARQGVRR